MEISHFHGLEDRITIAKMAIFPKLSCRFNAILIIISVDENVLKFDSGEGCITL